ncbi:MAG: PIN domain-containing protein [Actinomycetota bacterium]
MRGATLDAGALTAFERAKRSIVALITRALERGAVLAVPAGVIAQVWRDGARQARLVRLLASDLTEVVPLDDSTARAVGQLCGISGATDVVDVSVVLCARERGHVVVTGDPADLRRVDPRMEFVRI